MTIDKRRGIYAKDISCAVNVDVDVCVIVTVVIESKTLVAIE